MDISGLHCLYAWSFLVELEKHIIIARCHLISKGRQFIVDIKHFENRTRCYNLLVTQRVLCLKIQKYRELLMTYHTSVHNSCANSFMGTCTGSVDAKNKLVTGKAASTFRNYVAVFRPRTLD